ncbi:MAG: amidohydrolase [Acidobacteria bacterium]|nr:amidohydrolase [Acidobacteriota bacterium]
MFLVILSSLLVSLHAEIPAADRSVMLSNMDIHAAQYGELSRQIWEYAEVGHKEHRSAALLRNELRKAGFAIQDNIGGMPTAFTAEWGKGKPVIAIMGEYDALPGLSQETTPDRKPLVEGAPGHGCGHNLFGVAAAFAAITVKQWMEEKRIAGTIRFYGTPAEEGGGGKIYMIRAGAFQDADVAITWHPGSANRTGLGSSLANINAKFRFYGRASHAAAAPDKGRSGLDGLLLMNHAVELLREHVPDSTRIHYIITKGGAAPNVVPDFAEGYIYARSPSMLTLDNVWDRIIKCAQAGALGTETRMEMQVVNSVYNVLPNEPLARMMDRHLRTVGGVKYSPEERVFAEKLRQSVGMESNAVLGSEAAIAPFETGGGGLGGSTDVADVSWVLPTQQFTAATYVPGTPGHSWQSTACSGMSIGRKGMVVAAKVLALSAADLLTTPARIEEAKKDFEKRKGSHVYQSRMPAGSKPPLNYRDNP